MVQQFYGVIYLITCKVNGKQYVGQTVQKDPLKYLRGHFDSARRGGEKLLYNAIRKYGADNFTSEIIWYCPDKASLDVSENSFIELFETLAPNGYNLRGGGARGKFTDEARLNLTISHNRPESILKSRNSAVAAHARPEVKERMILGGLIGQNKPGVPEKKSIAIRAALADPKIRERNSANRIDEWSRSDRREKQRITMSDPVVNANWHAAMVKAQNEPENILRNRESSLGRRWINNGLENRFPKANLPLPVGWVLGKLDQGNFTGSWINNGLKNSRLGKNQQIPDGWTYGMIAKTRDEEL